MLPSTQKTALHASTSPISHRTVIVSTIDNLGKGAAGQAVQNMNLMCGLDETDGLLLKPTAY